MNKILIVDDLPQARSLLANAAEKAFPETTIELADSLRAGQQAAANCQFDLALIDLLLQDGHGTELISEMSHTQPNCTLVVASVMGDDDNLFKALQAGAQGYLLKDQSQDQLIFQLSGIANGSLPLSPSIARKLMQYFQPNQGEQSASTAVLSVREIEVLGFLAKGIRLVDIAKQLEISHHTVGDHVKNIYRKLNINSRAEAAIKAQGFGLL
ncbi:MULTISPECIES: response regulator transcription factor [unclassified Limnobacter]|mgnify:FL=1|jgi:DNA-binding NarL/FixJ family response regulator|uniref:response regulator n=1 Tax=unclassified Limnobacter TaxID=2630203 RepID=UPI000156CCAC|nr:MULTISPECIES: response regulator transcription factor [unclassified Limnobacter]EDM83263.1 putative DNA-binding response regulator [Limnobacter sp. MED105]